MRESNTTMRSLLAGLLSVGLFLFLFLVIHWHIALSGVLAVLFYFGLYFVTAPVEKIGNTPVDLIKQGERLNAIYGQAQKDMRLLAYYADTIQHDAIREKTKALSAAGGDILNYLTEHPQSFSISEHFLDYYLGTANRILKNYEQLERSNVSKDKKELILRETSESLDYLNTIFEKQRDSYYKETILELEVESDLLEKTVQLGGEKE